MKKTLLTGIAVLLLATGTAHAETWEFDNYKRCTATTKFELFGEVHEEWPGGSLDHPTTRGGPSFSMLEPPNSVTVTFEQEHLAKLEAAVRFLRKCRPWVWDRN